ncbi:hypothetical protein ACRWEA_27250, partial [Escherichia coli]
MEMLGKILVIIISMIIISCDYYNAGMDYQDNIALEQVVTWDSDNIFTPNIFEHNGRCFMKKNETWMLLNGKRLVRTVLIFTESSDQLSRATDRVPGLPASPG